MYLIPGLLLPFCPSIFLLHNFGRKYFESKKDLLWNLLMAVSLLMAKSSPVTMKEDALAKTQYIYLMFSAVRKFRYGHLDALKRFYAKWCLIWIIVNALDCIQLNSQLLEVHWFCIIVPKNSTLYQDLPILFSTVVKRKRSCRGYLTWPGVGVEISKKKLKD